MSCRRSASAASLPRLRSSPAKRRASRVTGEWRRAALSSALTLVPGVQAIGSHRSPAPGMPKLRNSGTTPAWMRLLLPDPEPPSTATNWVWRKRSMTSRTWRSRPNSSAASKSRKGRRPG